MRNKNYAFLLLSGIFGMVIGIGACLTIIGAIIGIPLIIGASKYLAWAKISDEELIAEKDQLMIWGIVFTILMFPLGGIALIPPLTMDQNLTGKTDQKEYKPTDTTNEKKSKIDRLTELSELKQKGLIDENDYEAAKKKILFED